MFILLHFIVLILLITGSGKNVTRGPTKLDNSTQIRPKTNTEIDPIRSFITASQVRTLEGIFNTQGVNEIVTTTAEEEAGIRTSPKSAITASQVKSQERIFWSRHIINKHEAREEVIKESTDKSIIQNELATLTERQPSTSSGTKPWEKMVKEETKSLGSQRLDNRRSQSSRQMVKEQRPADIVPIISISQLDRLKQLFGKESHA